MHRMATRSDRPFSEVQHTPWFIEHVPSPIGTIALITDESGLVRALDWVDHTPRMLRLLEQQYGSRSTRVIRSLAPTTSPFARADVRESRSNVPSRESRATTAGAGGAPETAAALVDGASRDAALESDAERVDAPSGHGALDQFLPRPRPSAATAALEAYFAGDIGAIDAIGVATGGTPFQRSVWAALRNIQAGRTTSYSALASTISRPRAVRAVSLANGSNPIGIIVPCHRVIGANGTLTGYGGGLSRKQWLLEHEGALGR